MSLQEQARGNTDPEWATVILRICGIEEEWRGGGKQGWVSSVAEIRKELEEVVQEIKHRTKENLDWHKRMEEATEFINDLINKAMADAPPKE